MGLRERVTRHGEEAIGKLATELLENPMVSGALSAAFETRERALRAQEAAMGALNLPSASDLERLTRRLRGVSQRLEGIEDGLDRLEQRLDDLNASNALDQRLAAIEEQLERIEASMKKAARPPRATRASKASPATPAPASESASPSPSPSPSPSSGPTESPPRLGPASSVPAAPRRRGDAQPLEAPRARSERARESADQ